MRIQNIVLGWLMNVKILTFILTCLALVFVALVLAFKDDPHGIYKRLAINFCDGEEKVKSVQEAIEITTKDRGKLIICMDSTQLFKPYPPPEEMSHCRAHCP